MDFRDNLDQNGKSVGPKSQIPWRAGPVKFRPLVQGEFNEIAQRFTPHFVREILSNPRPHRPGPRRLEESSKDIVLIGVRKD